MINTRWLSHWLGGHASGRESVHIPLGTFCHVAAALRDCGLRRWSGPFDWIFSTPAMLAECIDDDFTTLIDPRELESVPPGELTNGAKRQCRHRSYQARYGLPTIFNHHDPAGSVADLWRLRRAIERFRRALASGAPLSFYMLSEREWPTDEIASLLAALRRRAPESRLVVITIEPDGAQRNWTATDRGDGLLHLRVRTRTRSLGAIFPDAGDNALLAEALLGIGRGDAHAAMRDV